MSTYHLLSHVDLDTFTEAVIEALYFTDTGPDSDYEPDAVLDPENEADLRADCRSFWHRFGCFITAEQDGPGIAQAGHDFWYTRNGHGAGFWDGDWPTYGDMLSNAAKGYGEFYPVFEGETD